MQSGTQFHTRVLSPLGDLIVTANDAAVTRVHIARAEDADVSASCKNALLEKAASELKGYFAGELRSMSVPLAPQGTPFQQRVWQALKTIPYGETRAYSQIAQMIGSPKACRAVGMANNKNPIMILIPCHRVIGKDGSLTGYAGGLDKKRFLLELEKSRAETR